MATFTAPLQVAGANGVTALGGKGSYRGVAGVQADGLQGPVGDQRGRPGRLPAGRRARRSRPPRGRRRRCARRRSRRARTRSRRPRAPTSTTSPTRARRSTTASAVEQASTNAAVADTRGQIVTYQGQPVVTYFFSTSGGKTESVENTTLGPEPKPWLVSVDDEFDDVSPRHRWTTRLTMASASKKLGGLVEGLVPGHPRVQARRVAADHGRRGRRLARHDGRSTARRCGPSSGCSTRGRTSRRSAARPPASAIPPAARGAAPVRDGRPGAGGRAARDRDRRRRGRRRAGAPRRRVGRRRRRRAIGRSGAYRWTAPTRGTYRLVVDGAVGPAVATRLARVDAHHGLGDADRLLAALALEGDLEDALGAARDVGDLLQLRARADL